MVVVGLGFALSGLQLFDVPALWAIGAMADTLSASLLIHLLLAFPSGRLERRERRVAALAYAAAALQPLLIAFSTCDGQDCPSNPILIADDETVAGAVQVIRGGGGGDRDRGGGRTRAAALA